MFGKSDTDLDEKKFADLINEAVSDNKKISIEMKRLVSKEIIKYYLTYNKFDVIITLA